MSDLTVLDVAGGKGELVHKFLNLSGEVARAIVINPRPLELENFVRKSWMGFDSRSDHALQPHN